MAHSQEEINQGSGLSKYCEDVIAEVIPTGIRWRQAVAALPMPQPSSARYFWSSRLKTRTERVSLERPYDCVLVHCAFAAAYALGIKARFRILDYGDIDSGKFFDYARYKPWPLSVGFELEARKLRRYEIWLAKQFDKCTVTAPGEVEEFNKFNLNSECALIPNGVDQTYFRLRAARRQRPAKIAFLGRMDYFPNVDGILYFAEKIFPLILAKAPTAQLAIIGSNPAAEVKRLAQRCGISVTGYVPDVRPLLEDAALTVVPLRIARGTQNKMLESMSLGVPVVSTSIAAKGVDAIAGRDYLLADTPVEFAEQVLRVINSTELENSLASAGRARVQAAHNWSQSMRILDGLLETMLQRTHPSALRPTPSGAQ